MRLIMNANNISILILLVLYNCRLEDSLSYKSLCQNIHYLSHPYQILIYNNCQTVKIPCDDSYSVVNAPENKMLTGAYNYALNEAINNNIKWLLLLDQDTFLSSEYFIELSQKIHQVTSDTGALLPIIDDGDKQISPVVITKFTGPFGRLRAYRVEDRDLKNFEYLSGINSATVLNTKAIKDIGGFSAEFPLDFLDYWYFFRLYQVGYKVQVLNSQLRHNLSIAQSYNPMGEDRYVQYLKARALLAHKTNVLVLITFKLRTLGQCFTQIFRKTERKFFIHTFKALFY